MATEEHQKLAAFIKETHSRLRIDSHSYGPTEAWNRHIEQTDVLKQYAVSMRELATLHWGGNQINSSGSTQCRISWIKNQCYEYFLNGGREKYHRREIDIAEKNHIHLDLDDQVGINGRIPANPEYHNDTSKKICLLDVGSCYNPFGNDDAFDVTAIDIAPYSDLVLRCDFLNATVGSKTIISDDLQTILELGEKSFDVCVFSLLLEYLPCPEQRYLCCEKAYELLASGGILIIITPDSKHVSANAKLMKSWRFMLSKLGFMRINYEKLRHVHCVCYRKCMNKDVSVRWINLQSFPNNDILFSSSRKIFIPQDIRISRDVGKKSKEILYETEDCVDGFHELLQTMNK